MHAEVLGEHELRSHAIGARNQHRFLVTAGRQRKQPAEATDAGYNFRASGALDQRLDPLHKFVSCIYVDAGVFVR